MQGKVLIFTYAFNRPSFIEIQHKTFQLFVKDEYEFVVFNDANNEMMAQTIEQVCQQLGIRHVRIPQSIHDEPYLPRLSRESWHAPAVRNANVVMYSLNNVGFDHDDILVLLDSDIFAVKPVSFRELMRECDILGLPQARTKNDSISYLWIGFCCLNMKHLPNIRTLNFNCGEIDGSPVDAGGYSHYYLKNNPSVRKKWVSHLYSKDFACDDCRQGAGGLCKHNSESLRSYGKDMQQYHIDFIQHADDIEFFEDLTFVHYRSGSNWNNKSPLYIQHKTKAFHIFIQRTLERYV